MNSFLFRVPRREACNGPGLDDGGVSIQLVFNFNSLEFGLCVGLSIGLWTMRRILSMMPATIWSFLSDLLVIL